MSGASSNWWRVALPVVAPRAASGSAAPTTAAVPASGDFASLSPRTGEELARYPVHDGEHVRARVRDAAEAAPRLARMYCRFAASGIRASPISPGSCYAAK